MKTFARSAGGAGIFLCLVGVLAFICFVVAP